MNDVIDAPAAIVPIAVTLQTVTYWVVAIVAGTLV